MASSPSTTRTRRRFLWGYGPLAVGAVMATAVVVIVPSEIPDHIFDAGDIAARQVPDGQTASGWETSVRPCAERETQVENDDYAPPCFDFSGSNGGATSPGVTEDEISVSYRLTSDPNIMGILAQMSGMPFEETNEDLVRTAEGLIDYFNQNYEFYGRKLVLEGYQGRGALLQELFGAGQENATNDALRASGEVEAFADITALTQPYADALSRQQIVNIGAPYLSREWFQDRRPFAWSATPDCSTVSETASDYAVKKLMDRPAEHAEGDLKGQERRISIIAPDNLEYQQCVDAGVEVIEDAGHSMALRQEYVLDLAQTSTQAPGIVAKLKAENITSVAFAGDPLMLMALLQEANAQNYFPEWLAIGVGFVDLDLVGQLLYALAPDQWGRAFGGGVLGRQPAPIGSPAYQAYKSVRDDDPSLLVDVIYQQILPLALGVQMAGPDLTPYTFETGMLSYPEGTGVAGTWDWRPGNYTPIIDMREYWFDPNATSSFNGARGSYVDNGERYRQGELPEGEPEVFK